MSEVGNALAAPEAARLAQRPRMTARKVRYDPAMSTTPRLSFASLTREGPDQLPRCLASLERAGALSMTNARL